MLTEWQFDEPYMKYISVVYSTNEMNKPQIFFLFKMQLKNKNIFSLKVAENKNVQPGPEKQHPYKKRVWKGQGNNGISST